MKQLLSITRKEIEGYFGSAMALIFVGAFLAVTLFSFSSVVVRVCLRSTLCSQCRQVKVVA
jgi:hypothetical protein